MYQFSLTPEGQQIVEAVDGITMSLSRRVIAASRNQKDLDEQQRGRIAVAIDEAVRDLHTVAAGLMVPGRPDPAQVTQADVAALHEVQGVLGDLVRNIHIYLDGRATQSMPEIQNDGGMKGISAPVISR